jgi:hypothetical protein
MPDPKAPTLMQPIYANPSTAPRFYARRRGLAVLTSLLMSLGCLGLAACGSTSGGSSSANSTSASTTTDATSTKTSTEASGTGTSTKSAPATSPRELATIRALASCLRRHGIQLPEPDASGRVNTEGVNQSSPRYRAALTACLRERREQLGGDG